MKAKVMPKSVINLLFFIGLISAFAFRIIRVFQHIKPDLVRIVWYVGIFGYIIFFSYSYSISGKRKYLIEKHKLISKLKDVNLDKSDKDIAVYLLSSLKESRENLNYLAIFAFSVMAVVADLVLTYTVR